MVLESWEFIQGDENVPLFAHGTSRGRLRIACTQPNAHKCLRIIRLKREERRVALSSGLFLESYKWRIA